MNALIIQHEEDTTPGSTIEWLKLRNISYDIIFPSSGTKFPTSDYFDLLIICGGSMNVDEEFLHPWLKDEKDFILNCIQAGKKIMGLCLGAQLLAEMLGGQVHPLRYWEIGWQSVKIENEQDLVVFEWHAYQFTLPPNANILASNQACSIQAFSYKNILAFQFHPEATAEWVYECANDPEIPAPSSFIQSTDEIKKGMAHHQKMKEWYFLKLDFLMNIKNHYFVFDGIKTC